MDNFDFDFGNLDLPSEPANFSVPQPPVAFDSNNDLGTGLGDFDLGMDNFDFDLGSLPPVPTPVDLPTGAISSNQSQNLLDDFSLQDFGSLDVDFGF